MLPLRACALLAICLVAARAEDNRFPMRWRVFCDTKTGTCFSYPYDLVPADQYKGDLKKEGMYDTDKYEVKEITGPDGKKVRALVAKAGKEGASLPDIHHFSFAVGENNLTSDAKLGDIGDSEAMAKLSWKEYNYYQTPAERPFGDPKWADEGIEAAIGEGDDRCALVIHHGERFSGLVLKGNLSSGDNMRIISSLEVLSTGRKLKKGDKPDKKAHLIDWREAHCRVGKVFDSTGKLAAPPSGKVLPVSWRDGWELETEHYHITTDFSPQRLLFHAQYVEALYRAYTKMYQPDDMPPYKFEVHIYNTYQEFLDASAAHGNNIPTGPGSIVGGFFVPSLLSLWVYEQSGELGGPEFTIEHVMAHECSHQFLHVTCNGSDHIPTWINEGLAVYFENGIFQGGEFQIRSPSGRITELKTDYQQLGHTLAPLDQYLDHRGHIGASQYGEVYAMTMFWVFGTCQPDPQLCKHKNCGLKRFREYFQALRHKEDGAKAFDRIFMDDMVKAAGSHEKAVQNWQRLLMDYVATKLK